MARSGFDQHVADLGLLQSAVNGIGLLVANKLGVHEGQHRQLPAE